MKDTERVIMCICGLPRAKDSKHRRIKVVEMRNEMSASSSQSRDMSKRSLRTRAFSSLTPVFICRDSSLALRLFSLDNYAILGVCVIRDTRLSRVTGSFYKELPQPFALTLTRLLSFPSSIEAMPPNIIELICTLNLAE